MDKTAGLAEIFGSVQPLDVICSWWFFFVLIVNPVYFAKGLAKVDKPNTI